MMAADKIKVKRLSWLLILTLIALRSDFNPAVKKDLEISLEGKRIDALSGAGLTINFLLRIANSAQVEYQLIKTNFRTLINQQEFFRLETALEAPISVPPRSSSLINLPVKITYAYLFEALPSLRDAEKFTCNVVGTLTFLDSRRREQNVAFVAVADFPLFKEFILKFEPLQVKSLSLGGADLVFSFSLTNSNATTWILRSLEGQIELAGQKVAPFSYTFQDSLAPGESKKIDLALLLDFFELGAALQTYLEAPEVEASLSGEMEIESEWGRFRLPLSGREKVAVLRNDFRDHSHL
jgi:LEA14-like dessication related protein